MKDESESWLVGALSPVNHKALHQELEINVSQFPSYSAQKPSNRKHSSKSSKISLNKIIKQKTYTHKHQTDIFEGIVNQIYDKIAHTAWACWEQPKPPVQLTFAWNQCKC